MAETTYEEMAWTQPAPGLQSSLHYSADGVTALQIVTEGPCPRCGHHTSDSQWLVKDVVGLVEGSSDVVWLEIERRIADRRRQGLEHLRLPAVIEQQMICRCDADHPHRPSRRSHGCGAYWTLLRPTGASA